MVILGIDPGLVSTGYGVIDASGSRLRFIAAGDIRPLRTHPLSERLERIHAGLSELIQRHHPETLVLEQLFTHAEHVMTAALMGHARGMACLAAQEHGVLLAEYPPTHVKKSLTGNGHASKEQVARMAGQWLGYSDPSWSSDATDALALAVIHAHAIRQQRRLPAGAIG
jgi:crossover junction endodeoxyribonuclease RuvC